MLHENHSSSEEQLMAPQQIGARVWRKQAQGAEAAAILLLLLVLHCMVPHIKQPLQLRYMGRRLDLKK